MNILLINCENILHKAAEIAEFVRAHSDGTDAATADTGLDSQEFVANVDAGQITVWYCPKVEAERGDTE